MKQGVKYLVIFPDGSRGLPGEIRPFGQGAAKFSISLSLPIVPVFIHGSHKSWPKGKYFMRPTRIKVQILDPIYPNDYINEHLQTNSNPAKRITQDLEQSIRLAAKNFDD